jgi:tryptophan halogenase
MAATYLQRALQGNVTITVLEAPAVPRIGVGEATVPNLQRVFFDFIGIPEEEWMRHCNAAFKMAVKFTNWRTPGDASTRPRADEHGADYFYHPFGLLPEEEQIPLSHYWANKRIQGGTDIDFDHSCFKEPAIMDANLAPRTREGEAVTRYAWHFDAQLVADYLCKVATQERGVRHVQDLLTGVERDERGFITGLRTEGGRLIEGDLFIDCSGFRGLLINQAMGEPFIDMNDHLLNNSAVATQLPHDDAAHGVEPYTSAIAMNSGWTWRIPLLGRFGTGYVYSADFCTEDEAIKEFSRLWGIDPDQHQFNRIRFRVGRNRSSWVKNCVSIGLASCFLEPLESTGIYFTYAALYQLAKYFPDRRFDPLLRDRFNREIESMFDDTRDFIQAHFSLSPRTDTPFWQATKELKLPEDMVEKLAMYRAGLAINQPFTDESNYYGNFDAEFSNFWTNGSYYSIIAGLGVLPDGPLPALTYKTDSISAAEKLFANVRAEQQRLVDTLPTNHEYLQKLHAP